MYYLLFPRKLDRGSPIQGFGGHHWHPATVGSVLSRHSWVSIFVAWGKMKSLMINRSAAVMAGYKESIIKLLDYDVQDMLRTNVCTIVIYLTFSPP